MSISFKDYLEDKLGTDYRDNDSQLMFHCPFCVKNHDYKLYVNNEGGEKDGLWHCQRCKESGNPISFVMKYEKKSYPDAKDILEFYGYEDNHEYRQSREEGLTEGEALYLMLLRDKKTEEEQKKKVPPELPQGLKYVKDNLDNPEVIPYIQYLLEERNIEAKYIVKNNIGYVDKGYTTTRIGNRVTLDKQIIFFTYDLEGNYQYWNTRSIDPTSYLKTYNASAKDNEYTKSEIIYNLNQAIYYNELILVEGVLDALTIGEQGISSLGKGLTQKQVELIKTYVRRDQKIYVFYDKDAKEDTIETAQKLYNFHEETYIVGVPTNEDPNDLGYSRSWELINHNSVKATPKNILMYKLN